MSKTSSHFLSLTLTFSHCMYKKNTCLSIITSSLAQMVKTTQAWPQYHVPDPSRSWRILHFSAGHIFVLPKFLNFGPCGPAT